VKLCGNGALDFSESCDAENLGGWECGDIPALGKYAGGLLSCSDECVLDTSTCDPCWGYPCEPPVGYGRSVGAIIEDNTFIASNSEARGYGLRNDTPEEFALSYAYKDRVSAGGRWKGALIFVTTGWCPYCRAEALVLEERYQHYLAQGILFIAVVAQDSVGVTATAQYAEGHSNDYGWTFPTVAGEFPTKYWPDQIGYPLNMILDLETMEIVKSDAGSLMSTRDVDAYLADFLEQTE
jgi:thiol-disulfide isomerase/thioredoxin